MEANAARILNDIEEHINRYIECWKTGENKFINPIALGGISSSAIGISNSITPCEEKYLVFITKPDSSCPGFTWRYNIHTLPYSVVTRLPILLTRSLVAQRVNFDNRVLWSWVAQIYISPIFRGPSESTKNIDHDLKEAFEILVRSELASIGQPPSNKEVQTVNKVIDAVVGWNVKKMVYGKDLISLVLSFPVLERLCRTMCNEFVDPEGKVKKRFDVPSKQMGKVKHYKPGDILSSLRDLLCLYEDYVADDTTKLILKSFKEELTKIFPRQQNTYDLIYQWRNNSLHGNSMNLPVHAVLLNLICIILLNSISDHYDQIIQDYPRNSRFREMGIESPWSIYPPDLF